MELERGAKSARETTPWRKVILRKRVSGAVAPRPSSQPVATAAGSTTAARATVPQPRRRRCQRKGRRVDALRCSFMVRRSRARSRVAA